ncbi:hypothetical protein [Nitratidesulfovibrio liaohensis]|uniref:Uncharacterized protein n=1 Tax=Nitratidesulfovibrio liaohensis TaxID=2604158 RepID=A0ABY9QYI4_9BACT|nr:hypothetical protein [Nitratidesulfovibrio liaohensis]WMW63967.1 hypothetical protein KPS_001940 [Nitratidesulfovibrio liaohensis]
MARFRGRQALARAARIRTDRAPRRSFADTFGYRDILLLDPATGAVAYSVRKLPDFGTSLASGPYKGTGLAAVFR